MNEPRNNNYGERLGKVETSVEALHGEFSEMRRSFGLQLNEIKQTLDRGTRRDSGTLIASIVGVIGVVFGFYMAAIHPIENNVDRAEKSAEVLAEAVRVQNVTITQLLIGTSGMSKDIDFIKGKVLQMDADGTKDSDKRLSLVEQYLKLHEH